MLKAIYAIIDLLWNYNLGYSLILGHWFYVCTMQEIKTTDVSGWFNDRTGRTVGIRRLFRPVVSFIQPRYLVRYFYRATLCVSAVLAVGRCPSVCLSVCLSVCPSVTLVYFIFIFIHQWMVERMQCNIQSGAITLTTLKYSATAIYSAYIKMLTILIFLSHVININLTHENTSLVVPFFLCKTLSKPKLSWQVHKFQCYWSETVSLKNLFIVKSSDDNWDLLRVQASRPNSNIGIHLLTINCNITSSEASLPIFPNIALATRFNERFA